MPADPGPCHDGTGGGRTYGGLRELPSRNGAGWTGKCQTAQAAFGRRGAAVHGGMHAGRRWGKARRCPGISRAVAARRPGLRRQGDGWPVRESGSAMPCSLLSVRAAWNKTLLPGGSTLQLKQGPSDASRSGPHRVGRTEAGCDVAGIDVDSRPCTAGCQASAGPASALHQSMTGCRMRPQAFRLLSMFSQKTAARTRALPVQPSGLKNSSQNSQTQMVLRMGSR